MITKSSNVQLLKRNPIQILSDDLRISENIKSYYNTSQDQIYIFTTSIQCKELQLPALRLIYDIYIKSIHEESIQEHKGTPCLFLEVISPHLLGEDLVEQDPELALGLVCVDIDLKDF